MNFHEGDPVMHWIYGLGRVIRLEERELAGRRARYYQVQIDDMTIWVPDDEVLQQRLRHPTLKSNFQALLAILSGPGEPLPLDRQERKLLLHEWLKNGRAESLCRVIRSLSTYQQDVHSLNDNDQALLKRSQKALIAEWGFALSVTAARAELELQRLLKEGASGRQGSSLPPLRSKSKALSISNGPVISMESSDCLRMCRRHR